MTSKVEKQKRQGEKKKKKRKRKRTRGSCSDRSYVKELHKQLSGQTGGVNKTGRADKEMTNVG